jgi:hypothetical protein
VWAGAMLVVKLCLSQMRPGGHKNEVDTPDGGPLNQSDRRGEKRGSDRADVLRLRALLALGDVELHPLVLIEAAEAAR